MCLPPLVNPGNNFAAFQAAATGNSTANSTASTTASATSAAASSTSSSTTSGTDYKVIVGGPNKLYYDPSNITAKAGDTVTFQFMQKNHTVTQSTFASPCRALTLTSTSGQVGFDSGFMPVADGATDFPSYTIKVNDTAPIWAYCKQAGHCGSGMVFSVNAVETGPNNFGAFQAAAKQQNGTSASGSSTASSASSTGKSQDSGALSASQISRGAGIAVALVSISFGLLL